MNLPCFLKLNLSQEGIKRKLLRLSYSLEKVNSSQKVIFTSIPKTGTHLLLRYFSLLGFKVLGAGAKARIDKNFLSNVASMKKGSGYYAVHLPWSEEVSQIIRKQEIKIVFLYRDPRAQVCSSLHWIMKTPSLPLHDLFTNVLTNNEERLTRLIKGVPKAEQPFVNRSSDQTAPKELLTELYEQFAPWKKEPNCYSLRYEDIVGPKGGGNAETQLRVVRELMSFIKAPKGYRGSQVVANFLFDEKANTFRKGQINSWRQDFTPAVNALFMQEAGELLKEWGYAP